MNSKLRTNIIVSSVALLAILGVILVSIYFYNKENRVAITTSRIDTVDGTPMVGLFVEDEDKIKIIDPTKQMVVKEIGIEDWVYNNDSSGSQSSKFKLSPDRRYLAYLTSSDKLHPNSLKVISMADGKIHEIAKSEKDVRIFDFTWDFSNSNKISFGTTKVNSTSDNFWMIDFGLAKNPKLFLHTVDLTTGENISLTHENDNQFFGSGPVSLLSSSDGKFFIVEEGKIKSVDKNGAEFMLKDYYISSYLVSSDYKIWAVRDSNKIATIDLSNGKSKEIKMRDNSTYSSSVVGLSISAGGKYVGVVTSTFSSARDYTNSTSGYSNYSDTVWLYDTSSGELKKVSEHPSFSSSPVPENYNGRFAISPDGSQLIYPAVNGSETPLVNEKMVIGSNSSAGEFVESDIQGLEKNSDTSVIDWK